MISIAPKYTNSMNMLSYFDTKVVVHSSYKERQPLALKHRVLSSVIMRYLLIYFNLFMPSSASIFDSNSI